MLFNIDICNYRKSEYLIYSFDKENVYYFIVYVFIFFNVFVYYNILNGFCSLFKYY